MKINPFTWYGEREVHYLPKHFIRCNTEVTTDRKDWVYENLNGRFYVGTASDFLFTEEIYFEDPQEAMLYELRWS